MAIHFTSKSGGTCWSRDRGYHNPAPLPEHIKRIIQEPKPKRARLSNLNANKGGEE